MLRRAVSPRRCPRLPSPPAPALAERYVAGSDGSGDPYFPLAGNGGYDAQHYALTIEYTAETKRFDGDALVTARATQDLHRFNLDLRDFLTVASVRVNGKPADFEHAGQELSISPRPKLKTGDEFTVQVVYGGTQEEIVDPDHSVEGWVPTADGAYVVNEPQGSPGWYPVNDSPKDKATFDIEVTVPAGRTVMANGELISQTTSAGKTTWHWRELTPMAPYLATATNGTFQTNFYTLAERAADVRRGRPHDQQSGARDHALRRSGRGHRLLLQSLRPVPLHERRRYR